MRPPVDIHAEPLRYLRGCGLEVSYDDNKIVLTPMTSMTDTVRHKALRFAQTHKTALLTDLAAEEAGSRQ